MDEGQKYILAQNIKLGIHNIYIVSKTAYTKKQNQILTPEEKMAIIKRFLIIFLCVVSFSLAFAGTVSAASVLYNDTIEMGNGYQINNYVIDVTDVFVDANSVSFYVYHRDKEVKDILISRGDSFEFDIDDGGKVKVILNSVVGSVIPRASVSIVLTDYDFRDLHKNELVQGGHRSATFAGTPELKIIKSVDEESINVGDIVRVRVTVENVGDDRATEVLFNEPQQPRFILYDTLVSDPGKTTMDIGESKTPFVYELKATDEGTFELAPTTATFTNDAGQRFPQAASNSPTIIVGPSESLVSADLEFITTFDKHTVSRNERITGTMLIKNEGTAPATGVTVNIIVPDGMRFEGGSGVEQISGVPTIYQETFGIQQQREFSFVLRPTEVGTYTVSTQHSYSFDNGVDQDLQQVSSDDVSRNIRVTEGKYDYLFEQPLYVYVIPLLIIGAVIGWIYYRHKQYKF